MVDYTYEMRDAQTNRCCIQSVESIKADYRERPDAYIVMDRDFVEKHDSCDKFRCEELGELRDFVLSSIMHIPDCIALYDKYSDKVSLYREKDLFMLGSLSVDRTRESGYKKQSYNVLSHLINNNRYCPHNSPQEYRTVSSTKLDKAISNARKYLRGNTLQDIARATVSKVQYEFGKLGDKYKGDASKALNALGVDKIMYSKHSNHEDPPILKEMLRMAELGVVSFMDESVKDNLNKYVQSVKCMQDVVRQDMMTLCYVYTNHRDIEWCESHDVNVDGIFSTFDDKSIQFSSNMYCASPATRSASKVEPDLQARLASLAVVPDGTFVEGLGYKLNDNIYYVTKHDKTNS